MPVLIRYILVRISLGFILGASSAIGIILLSPGVVSAPAHPAEILFIVYGLGSTFALGYLATALAFEKER